MHQQPLARLQAPQHEYVKPCRHQRFHQPGGVLHVKPCGYGHGHFLQRDAVLRVAAAIHQRAHCVARLAARHSCADSDNFARHFQPRYIGRTLGAKATVALAAVVTIDACISHLDQHLPCGRLRHRARGGYQHFRPARLGDFDGGHFLR